VVEQARADWDGRAALAEGRECAAHGVRLASRLDPDFPARIGDADKPPLLLSVLGRWPPPERALAIVGARAATPYGLTVTRRLAGAAARAGFAVVSGLARGIDGAAHEAVLAEGGWPIAVLGNGLLVPYPPEHAQLQSDIARHGTLLSEFPLRFGPLPWTFPRRNRLIAALACKVLVVEAGDKSGALNTVEHAIQQHRDVLAVPGPIDSSASRGTNRLIADGAQVIYDVQSLLMALESDVPPPARPPEDPLLAALGGEALDVDELARRLHLPIAPVRAALVALELQGLVRRLEGGRYAMKT
jgi:DNA processing protein